MSVDAPVSWGLQAIQGPCAERSRQYDANRGGSSGAVAQVQ
jgi:hypothetical protein